MGKTVKTIVGAVVAVAFIVAGVITMNPQLIITGITIGVSTIASAMAKGPKVPKASTDRLQASIDPRTPRKGVFGDTAMGTDIRDQEFLGTDNEYLHRFLVVASHKVSSIREIWFDDKMAWSAAGGVQGDFVGYLTVATRLEGNAGNAINISARMGNTRRFTGCAYVHFRYKTTGNTKKTNSPFANNVPARITIIGEGMPVYDPRFDSTVPGGSGPARANDQTTWQFSYSGSNSGRNPACQMATYLLGWRIQNPVTNAWKLAVGKGVPHDRLDLPSFITAANLCDEAVTLAAGGTEPRYRSDGMFSEFDQATDVLDNLKATMAGELDDMDGLIRLTVLHNDLAVPVLEVAADDVLGDYTWNPYATLEETRNVVRGSYTDPSTKSLYQMVPYPDVVMPSPDGIERAEPINYAFVQSVSQAQRLSKQRLARAQFAGVFTAEFKSRLWRAQKGDVVSFTFGPAGFVGKPFRIVDMAVQVDGRVPITMREEHPNIYLWDADESPAVAAVASTPYTNFDLPVTQFLDTIQEGADVTASHAAADFAGRGALATLNAVDLATTQVVNKSLANLDAPADTKLGGIAAGATVGARTGTNLYRNNGTTLLADLQIVTAEGTAADFTGRGALATLNVVDLATAQVANKSLATLDVGANNKLVGIQTGATVGARSGVNLWRTDGVTAMAQAEVRTAEGTAADFTGRGALATLNAASLDTHITDGTTYKRYATTEQTKLSGVATGATVGARSGTNLYRTDGTTVLSQAEVRTAEGTAADFTGRGTLATLNAVDLTTAQVVNKSLANLDNSASTKLAGIAVAATVGARAGTNLYRTDGTTVLSQGEVRTAEGTAADFTGRGALATLNIADFMTNVGGGGKPAPYAGTTLSLYAVGTGTVVIEGNKSRLTSNAEFSSTVFARESFKGSGFARGRFTGGYTAWIGLTTDLTPAAGSSQHPRMYGTFHMLVNLGTAAVICAVNGSNVFDGYPPYGPGLPLPTANTFYGPVYVGRRVYFMLGDYEVISVPVTPGLVVTPRIDFWYNGAEVSDFAAGPAGDVTTYRDDGKTVMAQAEVRTAEGTAADFTGRGALATLNAVDLATAQVVNKSLANVDSTANTKLAGVATGATVGARAGTNMYRTDGTTVLTQAEVRTAEGTAADFTGRGALATLNAVTYGTGTAAGFGALAGQSTVALATQVTGRVPDSRSLNTSNNFGLRSLADQPAFTDTDNAGSVTINIPSVILYGDWGGSVTLPTGSVPGCAYNTLYVVYRVQPDPTTAGTSYGVTTDILQALGAGKSYLGAYRTRAAAGAPAPPPPPPPSDTDYGECVAAAALVETRGRGFVRADEIVTGDVLRVLTADREGTEWASVTDNYVSTGRRRRITSASGVSLEVSAGCPLTLRDGSLSWACEASAADLPVLVAGEPLRWEPCVLEEIEAGPVAHIHIQQRTYAAGDLAGRAILTHNPLQYVKKP